MGKVFCKPQDDASDSSSSLTIQKHIEFGSPSTTPQGEQTKVCKVVVLGQDSMAKTKLVRQYTDGTMSKKLKLGNTVYDIAVWDVPNSTFNMQDMTSIYCKNSMAAIILIDVTNPDALNHAYQMIQCVKSTNPEVPIIVLCNHWDHKLRLFQEDDIQSFCMGIRHFVSWQKLQAENDGNVTLYRDKIIKQMILKIIAIKLKSH
mmetsp:Transcript_64196/g.102220  ORF Transcript_64196/g.102220 Transcript_64196/m.102220 type:complete len:203 (-) Transcript_64196:447-1055(-)|eukprot:CAMPEP_0197022604 /NCGR_PEP_ID=MMETSP1384-20130603/3433_1 /TAXON_ID=29189 /ORGANISM="Ammonia sp." /LENGTH=202 /DNA_ID=CAMNT_0042450673 /DNA_START=112 /DNA_END=720 /DNA_ORIENTATION=+